MKKAIRSKSIITRLTPKEAKELKAHAKKLGHTVSEIVRFILREGGAFSQ